MMFRHILAQARQVASQAANRHRLFSSASQPPAFASFTWAKHQLAQIPTAQRPKVLQFDQAGTLIQPYCLPPLIALYNVFKKQGVTLTASQITGPMGKSKPEHIHELIDTFKLKLHPAEMFAEFNVELDLIIHEDTELTPFASDFLVFARASGLITAGTTGYFRASAEKAMYELEQVHSFASMTAADDLPDRYRKRHDLLMANMSRLGLAPSLMTQNIFFTDACSDVESVRYPSSAAHTAWVVAVCNYSTHNNIASKATVKLMKPEELAQRRLQTEARLYQAGAHLVIPDLSSGPLAILTVARALQAGLRPENIDRLALVKPEQTMAASPSCR